MGCGRLRHKSKHSVWKCKKPLIFHPYNQLQHYSIDTLGSMMYTAYHKCLLIRVLCSNCARGASSLKTSSFWICCCCKGRTAKRLQLYCLLGMYKVISFVFRDAIQKREVNLDENGREVVGVNQTVVRKLHIFILFDRIISRHLIPFVFPTIIAFFVCFLVVFWGRFLNVDLRILVIQIWTAFLLTLI